VRENLVTTMNSSKLCLLLVIIRFQATILSIFTDKILKDNDEMVW